MPGRVKCGEMEGENSGGSWLPEEKKANMWQGRRNSGGSWPPAFPNSSYKDNEWRKIWAKYFLNNLTEALGKSTKFFAQK